LCFERPVTRIERVFEYFFPHSEGAVVRLPAVTGSRDGWHGRTSLHSLLAIDPADLTADEALTALQELQRARGQVDALEAELLVRAAGATRVVRDVLVESADDDRPPRRVTMVDEVVDEIAAVLHRPVSSVQQSLGTARLLHGPLRATRTALAEGHITLDHARAIASQADRMLALPLGADPRCDEDFVRKCGLLEGRSLPHARRETAVETRQRARRVVASIDASGARMRRQRARCTRDVQSWGEDDGLGVVMARLAATDAAWVTGLVESHARAHADDGSLDVSPDATWGEVRSAAFLDLLRRPTAAPGQPATAPSVEIQVVIDLSTLVGLTPDLPASLAVGSSSHCLVDRDDVVALMGDPGTPVWLRRLVRDPLTGALVDRGAHRYAATPELVSWLVARDITCRHPGCTRRASTCDVDHVVDYRAGGATTRANTRMRCRRHHNRRTHGGWRIEDAREDGSCTMVSPRGYRFPLPPPDVSPGTAPLRSPDPEPAHPPEEPFPF
jgi:hypothetical protein